MSKITPVLGPPSLIRQRNPSFKTTLQPSKSHLNRGVWMNECMIIYNAHKNFHARICMFTAQGLGRKEFIVSTFMSATVRSTISTHTHTCNHMHTHTRTHTCTHMLTQRKDKWEGGLQVQWKRCVLTVDWKEWIVCLPDVPGQRIPLWKSHIYIWRLAG